MRRTSCAKWRAKKEPAQKTVRIKVEQAKFEQTTAYLTWRIPSVKHKDIAALEVMSAILGQGDSCRLMQTLRIKEPLTNSVGSFAYSMQDDGLFAVSLGLEKENLTKALSALIPELVRIVTGATHGRRNAKSHHQLCQPRSLFHGDSG
ncbi:M16 family metallopeptidase [Bdellovibrio bacteriovorus]|uniref:M16 family metallopeptidase n=1 Tax=Bdellovibrio bacteriovorus TaxID=959 RepID=UPI0035A66249